jgi:hypothetical protein
MIFLQTTKPSKKKIWSPVLQELPTTPFYYERIWAVPTPCPSRIEKEMTTGASLGLAAALRKWAASLPGRGGVLWWALQKPLVWMDPYPTTKLRSTNPVRSPFYVVSLCIVGMELHPSGTNHPGITDTR